MIIVWLLLGLILWQLIRIKECLRALKEFIDYIHDNH